MMSRTQLSLDSELHRKARDRATELGVSLAEYVRRLLTRDLERPENRIDPSTVFALGRSGGSDVARDKDEMLGMAASAQRRPAGR